MRLKVTKSLTYPEARKLYEQKPEFNFSKVVKSLAAKPESRTTSTQYSIEDTKITESTKTIVPRRITPKASTSDKMSKPNQSSSEQTAAQKKQNQQNVKPTNQQAASNRMPKGSEDPVRNYNRYSALGDDRAMDIDEHTVRQNGHPSRPRSPITAPKK